MTASVAPRDPLPRARVILVLIALCMLPPVFATAFYVSGWRPAHAVNHGALFQPTRALPDVSFRTLNDTTVTFRAWRDHWLLIYFAPPGCPPTCFDVLHDMRQLHLALGPEASRLQAVFILADETMAQTPSHGDDGILIVRTGPAERALLAATFAADREAAASGRHIYLADPLGNVIMSYRTDTAPTGIIQDLKRLLTYSWVG